MQDLIDQLQQPRLTTPSQAAMKAARALQELLPRAEADLKARILAEQKLTEAYADIQRLTKELQDAKENINKLTANTNNG